MSNIKRVLVTGATGSQGGSVVQALLKNKHYVRALTRNNTSPAAQKLIEQGVEVVTGDFTDQDSLTKAARDVDAVFAMGTPFEAGVEQETAQGISLVNAVKAAGDVHFVYSSVASADKATGIPHFDSKYEVEKHIAATGLNYTILAPVFFMDNVLGPWMLPELQKGKLPFGMPGNRTLQQVAVEDIGAFAVTLIERGEKSYGKRYDIAGDSITGDKAVSIISELSGREIVYEGFSPDAIRAENKDMALMYDWFDSVGYSVDIEGLRKDFPEVNWHDYKTWASKQDWSVL